jgi:hypothetical protein
VRLSDNVGARDSESKCNRPRAGKMLLEQKERAADAARELFSLQDVPAGLPPGRRRYSLAAIAVVTIVVVAIAVAMLPIFVALPAFTAPIGPAVNPSIIDGS